MPNTTNRQMVRIHNIETNEVIDREMNDAEFLQIEEDQLIQQTVAETKAKTAADKAALLTRLGITAEEAKLLLQ
jgi:hypothetical protein